jgi:hypothetical protein
VIVSETSARQQQRAEAAIAEAVCYAHDHRLLADAVTEQIGMLSGDGDSWDGDSDELTILLEWLELSGEWLPELHAHLAACKIRAEVAADKADRPKHNRGRLDAADLIDPWTECTADEGWGTLIRKSDGAPVPWQFAAAALIQTTGGN